jgi:hypothetical protein
MGGHFGCFGFFDVDEEVNFADVEGNSGFGYYGELNGKEQGERQKGDGEQKKTNGVYKARANIPIASTNSSRIQTQTSASSDVSDLHNTHEDHAKDARIQSRTSVLSARKVAPHKASRSEYPIHGSDPTMLSPRSTLRSPDAAVAAVLVVVLPVPTLSHSHPSESSSNYDKDKSQRTDPDTKPSGWLSS